MSVMKWVQYNIDPTRARLEWVGVWQIFLFNHHVQPRSLPTPQPHLCVQKNSKAKREEIVSQKLEEL